MQVLGCWTSNPNPKTQPISYFLLSASAWHQKTMYPPGHALLGPQERMGCPGIPHSNTHTLTSALKAFGPAG